MSTTEKTAESSPATLEDKFYGSTPGTVVEPTPAPAPAKEKPAESEPATPSEEGKPAKTAPESEPGEQEQESKPHLSDEERSARDKRNNDRRWNRMQQQLGEARATIKRMQEEQAARPQARQPESAPGLAGTHLSQVPPLEQWTGTLEEHRKALVEAAKKDGIEEFQQRQQQETVEKEQQTIKTVWGNKVGKFTKSNPDVDWATDFDHVSKAIDESAISAVVANAVFESDHGPAMVAYLADHEDELAALVDMPNFKAMKTITALEAKIEASLKPSAPAPPLRTPKAPSTVSGAGSTRGAMTTEELFYGKD